MLQWIILVSLLLMACQSEPLARAGGQQNTKIANPASVHCVESGGELRIEKLGNGGEIGVCWFEEGRRCEEWALFRGECPVGGRRVTGYATPGARYCAIRGGRYAITQDEGAKTPERGLCTLPDGSRCDAHALWNGTCP